MKEKSLRKVIENINKNKVEILELKSTITKNKQTTNQNSVDGFSNRVERADERISKLENKTTGLPWWSSGWKSTCHWRGHGSLVWEDSHAIKQLSLWTTATEAHAPRACAPKQETPSQWEAHTLQQRVALEHRNERKSMCSNKDPVWPKINTFENRTTPDFKNEWS